MRLSNICLALSTMYKGFGAGAALALDFTSGNQTLDPRVTFSRTTNATLTNSAGLVANAPMNLLTYSEQFDNAYWLKIEAAVSANQIAAPDGTLTADKILTTSVNSAHVVYKQTIVSTGVITISVYAKAAEYSWLFMSDTNTVLNGANFNLSTGTLGTVGSNATATIASAGNGWYKCTVTTTASAGSGIGMYVQNANNVISFAGNATSGIYLWGAQLELGSTATTYNPTTVKNLLGYTEHFDNAAWTKSNASISATKVDDIYGQPFAQKLVENTANAGHFVEQSITGGTRTTGSYYVKAGERTKCETYLIDSVGIVAGSTTVYNLANGTVESGSGSITDIGNGWYRVGTTATMTAGAQRFRLLTYTTADVYTGDGTSGIYIFGAQLSDSASVDPYVYNPVAAPSAAAYYGPRFDYDPVTLAPKGLLIEEQRTNRTLYSEDFTGLAWAAAVTGTSTRANNGAPMGFTRGLITATSANGGIRQIHSGLTSGQVYALSFYIQSTTTSVSLTFENGTAGFGSAHAATLNPAAGTFAVGTGFTSVSVQSFGAGYVYTLITAAAGGALAANIEWRITNSGDSVQLGRPQFEAGAFATSYIPTVASQVTRVADSASMIGNNFARWYNQTEGTLFSDAVMANQPTGADYWLISDGTLANSLATYNVSSSVVAWARTGGVTQVSIAAGIIAPTSQAKIAYGYKLNDFAASMNAGAAVTDTSATVPVTNQFSFGFNSTNVGGPQRQQWIKRIAYYNRRLSNTELQGITS